MAEKIPLSVAETVDQFNPFASVLEGLASGLSAFLQTRFQLDEADAKARLEQQKFGLESQRVRQEQQRIGISEAAQTETERANQVSEGRTRDLDAIRSQLELAAQRAAGNDARHQREMLAAEGRLQRALSQGPNALRSQAAGIAELAADMERQAAVQETQGQDGSFLRAQATNFWNLARLWDPDLNVPTLRDRRAEALRGAGISDEAIAWRFHVEDNPDIYPDIESLLPVIAQFPELRGIFIPPGMITDMQEIQTEAESRVKATEKPITTGFRKVGEGIGGIPEEIRRQSRGGPGISSQAQAGATVARLPLEIFSGIGELFRGRPKAADVFESQAAKEREKIQAENRRLAGRP